MQAIGVGPNALIIQKGTHNDRSTFCAEADARPANDKGWPRMLLCSPHIGSAVLVWIVIALQNLRQVLLVPSDDVVHHRLEALADVHVVTVPWGVLQRYVSNVLVQPSVRGQTVGTR